MIKSIMKANSVSVESSDPDFEIICIDEVHYKTVPEGL